MNAGVPGHLFAENHFTINDSRALAVTGAKIEADATPVQMTAERSGRLAFLGSIVERAVLHHEGPTIHPFAHEMMVEGAYAVRRVDVAEVRGDGGIAGDGDAIPALLPQQKFQQAFDIALVEGNVRAFVRQHGSAKDGDRAFTPLESDGEVLAEPAFFHLAPVRAVPESGWSEVRVEDGAESGRQTSD